MQIAYPIIESCNNGQTENCAICSDYCHSRQQALEKVLVAVRTLAEHRSHLQFETVAAFSALLGVDLALASLEQLEWSNYLANGQSEDMPHPPKWFWEKGQPGEDRFEVEIVGE